MKSIARLLSLALVAFFVTACFSPLSYKGGTNGKLNIVLGHSGVLRSALEPVKDNLRYDLTFHGPDDQTINRTASWGETVSVQAAAGVWGVRVTALDPLSPETVKAIGEETVTVKAGASNTAAVKMAVYTEVTNWTELSAAVTTGTGDDFIVIKNDFNGSAGSSINLTVNKKVTIVAESDKTIGGSGLSSFGSFFSINSGHLVLGGSPLYSGTLTLNGSGFSGTLDALVVVNSGGSFTMHSGVIKENSRGLGSGGGVNISGGTFTMTGGEIYRNVAGLNSSNGGGVFITGGGTFTMTGGTISENSAPRGRGGGVYIDNGTFNLNSPATRDDIRDNTVGILGGLDQVSRPVNSQVDKGSLGTFRINGVDKGSY